MKVDLQGPPWPCVRVKSQRGDAGGDGDGSDRPEGSSRTSTLTFIEKYKRYFRGRKENKIFLWRHWGEGGYIHWNEKENTAAECGAFFLSICHSPNHFCQAPGTFQADLRPRKLEFWFLLSTSKKFLVRSDTFNNPNDKKNSLVTSLLWWVDQSPYRFQFKNYFFFFLHFC